MFLLVYGTMGHQHFGLISRDLDMEMISYLKFTGVAVSEGMGSRKGREELILSWVIAQPEASRLSKPLMFVCGKQPRPSL